ncbi:DUF2750 domain-containing protein [Catenovulum sp. SM1970]|uniref:DUF2750 domain-containing protein n=1 Tax=Marinifaba aquimaris TaxID=2741323 RepID=UPI0015725209|nr:DUF2750 domain-containing protein [Marinifaba aquimaris]NTS76773.1 DUF2750 domain-containing protein [Marinifaba aquimaris]
MSTTTEQVLADFYQQVASDLNLFTIRDEQGIPTPNNSENIKAMPFWSSQALAQAYLEQAEGFANFEILPISWADFSEKWVPGMWRDGLCAGINWQATAESQIDVELDELVEAIKALIPAE